MQFRKLWEKGLNVTQIQKYLVYKIILIHYYPLANKVAKGYSNATVLP